MGIAPTVEPDFQPWSVLLMSASLVPWMWVSASTNVGHGEYPNVGACEMPSINPPELDLRTAFLPPAGRGSENSSVPRASPTSGLQPQ
eukprot:8347624-Pyramimonas_sp.AAC.1